MDFILFLHYIVKYFTWSSIKLILYDKQEDYFLFQLIS